MLTIPMVPAPILSPFRRLSSMPRTARVNTSEVTNMENMFYNMTFKQYVAGDDDDPIVNFSTNDYAPDADFTGYDDETGIFLHTIDNDGTHRYFDL